MYEANELLTRVLTTETRGPVIHSNTSSIGMYNYLIFSLMLKLLLDDIIINFINRMHEKIIRRKIKSNILEISLVCNNKLK